MPRKNEMNHTSGLCVECHQETEDRHADEWMCDECNEQLEAQHRQDCKLDSPQHVPYSQQRKP